MNATPSILHLTAGVEDLTYIREFLRDQALRLRVDDSICYDIQLAVTELVTNTLLYGYASQRGFIEIVLEWDGSNLLIWIRDKAKIFDPHKAPAPNLTNSLVERPLGGNGIYLALQSVDALHHRPLPEGGNEIELIVHLKN